MYISVYICDDRIIDGAQDFMSMMSGNDTFCKLLSDTMNFIKQRDYTKPRLMKDGDLVIVYERHDSLEHMYLSANTIFQNKYGTFPHNEIIGKPFGSKINSKTSSGWLYILEPTPELWSNAVHVSGIVNSCDRILIISKLVPSFTDSYPNRRRTRLQCHNIEPRRFSWFSGG